MGKLFLKISEAIIAFNDMCKKKWNSLLYKLMFKDRKAK
jgi:hypothetical protein